MMKQTYQQTKKLSDFSESRLPLLAEWVGVANPVRGKPSNDLAKMPKLQFVVLMLNLPLYIVFIHCEILLKTFWLHHKYMEQRGT